MNGEVYCNQIFLFHMSPAIKKAVEEIYIDIVAAHVGVVNS